MPAAKSTTSSRTSLSVGSVPTWPSRTTVARGALRRVSLSMVRLERISWTMPMSVLATAMTRKSISRKSPTKSRQTARTTKIRLKKVKTLSRTI